MSHLARLLLAACVVLAGWAGPAPTAPDPDFRLARAAGMLCQADKDSAPSPGHAHENCLACTSLGAAGLPVPFAAPVLLALPKVAAQATAEHGVQDTSGRAAYASRAPPGRAA